MSSRFEIRLTEANDEAVNLRSLTTEALDSFMCVVSALKAIVVSVKSESLRFSIHDGSAVIGVDDTPQTMETIYCEVDKAIKGESEDKELTSQLRKIQEQFQNQRYRYKFIYTQPRKKDIELHTRLIKSNRISIKRRRRPYYYKVKILRGFLNQIGGKEPNYHFDYGHGDKITISCTVEQARSINKYLYQTVDSLVVCKEWNDQQHEDEYFHKLILPVKEANLIKPLLNKYNKEQDLVNKLTLLHDFIDSQFEKSKDSHELVKLLLVGFNDKNFHLSEIKTMLVISKPFEDHEVIKTSRQELLETYNSVRY